MKYQTIDGDVLDAICTEYYGADAFDLTVVYAANMGLARLGPVFAAGILIDLPEATRVSNEPAMISLVD